MTHLKSYLGSIVLAGLLLQGCGSDSSNTASIVEDTTAPSAVYNTPSQASLKLTAISEVFSESNDEDAKQALSDLTLKYAALDANDKEFKLLIDRLVEVNEDIPTRLDAYRFLAETIVGNTSASAKATLKGPRRSIFSKIKDKITGVTDTVKVVVDKTTDAATTVVDKTTDIVTTVADKTTDTVATVADKTTDTVATVVDKTTDTVATVVDKTTDTVTTVADNTTDTVKDGLVDLLDSSIGDKITGAAFDVVLNSEGVTVVMLDAARASDTTSEVMVNALEANWSLTEKMCPMLRDNVEFGEKFTALAEEKEIIGKFFFERIDATMYNCLSDAMLLSNRETGEHSYSIGKPVKHSTNGYMALLMDRYATDYFIMPTGSTEDRRNDKFVGLMLDTGAIASYDAETKTFTNHGDANELINEKFFYSIFKTPTSTDMFVSAMQKIDPAVKKMLMDSIFLGQPVDATAQADTLQGYMNIISIGSAMYDGIYGEADVDGVRKGAYGFGSYMGAFVGFAGLIPSDRYMTYGKAFVNAGYQYAAFHGINVWSGVSEAAQYAWDSYSGTTDTTVAAAPARSGGNGIYDSAWMDDSQSLLSTAWDNFDILGNIDFGKIYDSAMSDDVNVSAIDDLVAGFQGEVDQAVTTVIGPIDSNGTVEEYLTTLETGEEVAGIHGLVELAMQEDIYNVQHESNASYTMDDAKAAFTLPPFADITFDFAYNTAADGAMAYYDDNIAGNSAQWLADLSSNDLIREYFYPSADNAYIPSWMLAIDWLSVPASYVNSQFAGTDFDFNAGYFDVYVTSPEAELITNYAVALEGINITKIDMSADSIIAVDANGQTLDGLYVYKIRAVSQADLDAIFAAISDLGDQALTAVGLDSSNASTVDTTDANTTSAQ